MKTQLIALVVAIGVTGLTGCVCGLQRHSSENSLAPQAKVGRLGGTSWELLEVNGAAINLDSVKARPYLEFSADGRISGMAGCNGLFAIYEADAEAIKIDGLGTTKMFCPTGMDTESRFLGALNNSSRYRTTEASLELLDSASTILARFGAAKSVQ